MTFTVFGTGAIGGYYGAKLAKAGNKVLFLVRSDYDWIKSWGLTVLSPTGDIHLENPPVYNSPEEVPPSDIILITLKTTGNRFLKEQLAPLVHENTAILVMQNGMGMEEEISNWFPHNPVLGGMCFICSRKKAPGIIEHQDKGSVTIGSLRSENRELAKEVTEIFNQAGVESRYVENLQEARWRKLLWNIPYNGLTVVLKGNTKDLMDNDSSRKIVENMMEEVLGGAAACGCPIEREAIDKMLHDTDSMTPYEPSMKLDYLAGRPMEIEYMYEKPLSMARKAGYEMKGAELLARQLRYLEDKN